MVIEIFELVYWFTWTNGSCRSRRSTSCGPFSERRRRRGCLNCTRNVDHSTTWLISRDSVEYYKCKVQVCGEVGGSSSVWMFTSRYQGVVLTKASTLAVPWHHTGASGPSSLSMQQTLHGQQYAGVTIPNSAVFRCYNTHRTVSCNSRIILNYYSYQARLWLYVLQCYIFFTMNVRFFDMDSSSWQL